MSNLKLFLLVSIILLKSMPSEATAQIMKENNATYKSAKTGLNCTPVWLEEFAISNSVRGFSNPAIDHISTRAWRESEVYGIELFDLIGDHALPQTIVGYGALIVLNNLLSGAYFIKLNPHGGREYTDRIIISNQ